jgi:hypothetical protein
VNRLRDFLIASLRRRPLAGTLWLLLAAAAVVQTARVGIFMFDPTRIEHSIIPGNAFFQRHWCASAYVRAAQLARAGAPDLYQADHYGPKGKPAFVASQRPALARLDLDRYEYPPPFLLLPRLGLVASADPLWLRAGWYVLEGLLLAAVYLGLAAWLGGAEGRRLALLLPLFWSSLPVLAGLQMGNFHLAMVAICLVAMMAFSRGRDPVGGALLAFAVASKLSPGLLVVYLAARGRWRAVAWTAAFGALLVALSLLLFGWPPHRSFLSRHLWDLASGEAFSFIFDPAAMAARPGPVAGNLSLYGLVMKLQRLGVPGMTVPLARAVSAAYLIGILALAVALGRRVNRRPPDRRHELLVWLALLSLAAWQSPFAPPNYGLLTAIWMLAVLAADPHSRAALLVFLGGWLLTWLQFLDRDPGSPLLFPFGLTVQALALALVARLALRVLQPGAVAAMTCNSTR